MGNEVNRNVEEGSALGLPETVCLDTDLGYETFTDFRCETLNCY